MTGFTLYAVAWESGRQRYLFDCDSLQVASVAAAQVAMLPGNHDVIVTECVYDVGDADFKRLKARQDYVLRKMKERQKSSAVEAVMREASGGY